MAEDFIKLMKEFEENGWVTRTCPKCKNDCEPTEIDANSAFCSNCEEFVKVPYLV
jgi:acetyl-CoA carboxylase beta subunit